MSAAIAEAPGSAGVVVDAAIADDAGTDAASIRAPGVDAALAAPGASPGRGQAPLALIACEGISFAHIARAILIAERIRQHGWRVVLAGPPGATSRARARGMPVLAMPTTAPTDAVFARFASGSSPYRSGELCSAYHRDAALIATVRPQLVVSEFRTTAVLAAESAGIASAAVIEGPCHPGFIPPPTAPQSYCPMRAVPVGWYDAVQGTAVGRLITRRCFRAAARDWRQASSSCGFAVAGDWSGYHARADHVLIHDHPALMPLRGLRDHDRWLPVGVWDEGRPLPTDVAALIARCAADERPLAYVSAGTQSALDVAAGQELVRDVVAGLIAAGLGVILSRGGRALSLDADALPTHARLAIAGFIDEGALIGAAPRRSRSSPVALCVHPGGAMSTYRFALAGVPQLHLPVHAQQHFYAHALAATGAGSWCRPAFATVSAIVAEALATLAAGPAATILAGRLAQPLADPLPAMLAGVADRRTGTRAADAGDRP